jgi:alkylation response protein AidB-like acyl-CoA dehydrogenase
MAVLTEEQSMLRDAARTWTQEKSPVSAFRKMRDSGQPLGYDPAAFAEMAEMGWTGVIIPEEYGGSDFGYLSLGLVLEETGRTLTASPLLATALAAASALILGGSAAQKEAWLPKIAAGETVGTLAIEEGPHHAPEKAALAATKSGAGYSLSGKKTFVLEGMAAGVFVVSARTSGKAGDKDGITLFVVPADAKGVSRKALKLADSRGAAIVTFENVAVGADAVLGEADKGYALLEKVLDRARAGLAAEMLGSAIQAFDTTLDYLKTRVQFGQVIGSFQALQHRAAKMFTDLELARSCVEAALAAIDSDSPDVPELVSLAKAKVGDTLHLVSNEMVQMHGGIGMTDAHDAGFYLKRARAAEATFGGQAYHRDRYARINGY